MLSTPNPERFPKKPFKPTCPEVPVLENYIDNPSDDYWSHFQENKNEQGGSPFKISAAKLEQYVMESDPDFATLLLLKEVLDDINNGCDLAISAEYVPTVSRNAPSCATRGPHISDMLAKGLKDKILIGPLKTKPRHATVNSLQPADRHDGKVRLIINYSSPKGRGINSFITKDTYPARMGGMKEVLYALNWCGRGARFSKNDWCSAYKHLAVRHGQLKYQYFKWLNRYFCELCLVFGCVSSVGLYDRFARLVIWIAMKLESYLWFLLVQHLDDFIIFGPAGDDRVDRMYKRYWEVCTNLGISLQEPADASLDKAYPPTTRGSILGIWFDTILWQWWISEEKVSRYVNDLLDMMSLSMTTQRKVWESVGKVLYVAALLPGSKYHISEMLRVNNMSDNPSDIVVVTKALKAELAWWIPMIRLIGRGMPIPSCYDECPLNALQADSDAAGGTLKGGAGVGIVMGNKWTQMLWPPYVNSDAVCECGSKFRHKMSF